MKKFLVYCLTRDDGGKYIGTTNESRIKRRMAGHRCSPRFKGRQFSVEILYETYCLLDCYEKEEAFITELDTYHNGLNGSVNGRGKNSCTTFTTLGTKLSPERKQHLSEVRLKAIAQGTFIMPKKNFTEEDRKELSRLRKGKRWGPTKMTQQRADEIRQLFETRPEVFIPTKSGSGNVPSYLWAFCKQYAEQYGVTAANMRRILLRETWNGAKDWNAEA